MFLAPFFRYTIVSTGFTPSVHTLVGHPHSFYFQRNSSVGLGVGLALGRRIVERMGGTLDLRNGAREGVEVTLILPGQG